MNPAESSCSGASYRLPWNWGRSRGWAAAETPLGVPVVFFFLQRSDRFDWLVRIFLGFFFKPCRWVANIFFGTYKNMSNLQFSCSWDLHIFFYAPLTAGVAQWVNRKFPTSMSLQEMSPPSAVLCDIAAWSVKKWGLSAKIGSVLVAGHFGTKPMILSSIFDILSQGTYIKPGT